jgi:hypothetical protein
MPFTPGDPNINRNGRPKGSPNKITEDLREAFALVLENNLPQLEILLARVAADDPKSAMELILKLSNRFLPELSRQELTGNDGSDLFKNVKFQFGPDINSEDEREDV